MLTPSERKLLNHLNNGDYLTYAVAYGWRLHRADVQVATYVVAALIESGLVRVSPGSQTARIGRAGRAALGSAGSPTGERRRVAA